MHVTVRHSGVAQALCAACFGLQTNSENAQATSQVRSAAHKNETIIPAEMTISGHSRARLRHLWGRENVLMTPHGQLSCLATQSFRRFILQAVTCVTVNLRWGQGD